MPYVPPTERTKLRRATHPLMTDLRKLRRLAHLKQETLAGQAGLSREALVRAEGGSDPKLSSVLAIADALGYKLELVKKGEPATSTVYTQPETA